MYLHGTLCDSHHAWDQTGGESERDAGAGEGAVRGQLLEVVLQGGIRRVRAMGVAGAEAGGL